MKPSRSDAAHGWMAERLADARLRRVPELLFATSKREMAGEFGAYATVSLWIIPLMAPAMFRLTEDPFFGMLWLLVAALSLAARSRQRFFEDALRLGRLRHIVRRRCGAVAIPKSAAAGHREQRSGPRMADRHGGQPPMA